MKSTLPLRVRKSGHKIELCSNRDHLFLSLTLDQQPWTRPWELYLVTPTEDSSPINLVKFCPGPRTESEPEFPTNWILWPTCISKKRKKNMK